MEQIILTLRQKKILYILQNHNGFIRGSNLADELNVTVRTIRNDVSAINSTLKEYDVQVESTHSKGYRLNPEAAKKISSIVRIDTVFFTKEDRIRYLAFQLCVSDTPLDLGELEDEMYVSQTTLKNDIRKLHLLYSLSFPYIKLEQENGKIIFEDDEVKKRHVLNILFSEHWNYNGRSNAFYNTDFLDDNTLNHLLEMVPVCLSHHHIIMEDVNMVTLNLACAIMYKRLMASHPMPEAVRVPIDDYAAYIATEEIIHAMEVELKFSTPPQERDAIYTIIANNRMADVRDVPDEELPDRFGPITQAIVRDYLKDLKEVYDLDFSTDKDFYRTLLQYVRDIRLPYHVYNDQESISHIKGQFPAETEMAWLFQRTSSKYLGYYVGEFELAHLAACLSGAMDYFYHHHPENKLHTAIFCHLHMSIAWSIKRKILGSLDNYIEVTDLLPVNSKSTFDFSKVDLILSTVKKRITSEYDKTIVISPFMDMDDMRKITDFISIHQMLSFYPHSKERIQDLLKHAIWKDSQPFNTPFQAIIEAAKPLIEAGIVSDSYTQALLRRESLFSNVYMNGIMLQFALEEAKRTQISFLVFRHRMTWKDYRVRGIVTVCFFKEELRLLFPLKKYIWDINRTFDPSHTVHCSADLKALLLK